MHDAEVLAAIAVALILGLRWAHVAVEHLREQKVVKVREMIHRETMTALEKGLPVPEPAGELARWLPEPPREAGPDWGARGALGAGIVLFMGGVGFQVAFREIPAAAAGLLSPYATELAALRPLGTIPILVGVGLVFFAMLVNPPTVDDDGDAAGSNA